MHGPFNQTPFELEQGVTARELALLLCLHASSRGRVRSLQQLQSWREPTASQGTLGTGMLLPTSCAASRAQRQAELRPLLLATMHPNHHHSSMESAHCENDLMPAEVQQQLLGTLSLSDASLSMRAAVTRFLYAHMLSHDTNTTATTTTPPHSEEPHAIILAFAQLLGRFIVDGAEAATSPTAPAAGGGVTRSGSGRASRTASSCSPPAVSAPANASPTTFSSSSQQRLSVMAKRLDELVAKKILQDLEALLELAAASGPALAHRASSRRELMVDLVVPLVLSAATRNEKNGTAAATADDRTTDVLAHHDEQDNDNAAQGAAPSSEAPRRQRGGGGGGNAPETANAVPQSAPLAHRSGDRMFIDCFPSRFCRWVGVKWEATPLAHRERLQMAVGGWHEGFADSTIRMLDTMTTTNALLLQQEQDTFDDDGLKRDNAGGPGRTSSGPRGSSGSGAGAPRSSTSKQAPGGAGERPNTSSTNPTPPTVANVSTNYSTTTGRAPLSSVARDILEGPSSMQSGVRMAQAGALHSHLHTLGPNPHLGIDEGLGPRAGSDMQRLTTEELRTGAAAAALTLAETVVATAHHQVSAALLVAVSHLHRAASHRAAGAFSEACRDAASCLHACRRFELFIASARMLLSTGGGGAGDGNGAGGGGEGGRAGRNGGGADDGSGGSRAVPSLQWTQQRLCAEARIAALLLIGEIAACCPGAVQVSLLQLLLGAATRRGRGSQLAGPISATEAMTLTDPHSHEGSSGGTGGSGGGGSEMDAVAATTSTTTSGTERTGTVTLPRLVRWLEGHCRLLAAGTVGILPSLRSAVAAAAASIRLLAAITAPAMRGPLVGCIPLVPIQIQLIPKSVYLKYAPVPAPSMVCAEVVRRLVAAAVRAEKASSGFQETTTTTASPSQQHHRTYHRLDAARRDVVHVVVAFAARTVLGGALAAAPMPQQIAAVASVLEAVGLHVASLAALALSAGEDRLAVLHESPCETVHSQMSAVESPAAAFVLLETLLLLDTLSALWSSAGSAQSYNHHLLVMVCGGSCERECALVAAAARQVASAVLLPSLHALLALHTATALRARGYVQAAEASLWQALGALGAGGLAHAADKSPAAIQALFSNYIRETRRRRSSVQHAHHHPIHDRSDGLHDARGDRAASGDECQGGQSQAMSSCTIGADQEALLVEEMQSLAAALLATTGSSSTGTTTTTTTTATMMQGSGSGGSGGVPAAAAAAAAAAGLAPSPTLFSPPLSPADLRQRRASQQQHLRSSSSRGRASGGASSGVPAAAPAPASSSSLVAGTAAASASLLSTGPSVARDLLAHPSPLNTLLLAEALRLLANTLLQQQQPPPSTSVGGGGGGGRVADACARVIAGAAAYLKDVATATGSLVAQAASTTIALSLQPHHHQQVPTSPQPTPLTGFGAAGTQPPQGERDVDPAAVMEGLSALCLFYGIDCATLATTTSSSSSLPSSAAAAVTVVVASPQVLAASVGTAVLCSPVAAELTLSVLRRLWLSPIIPFEHIIQDEQQQLGQQSHTATTNNNSNVGCGGGVSLPAASHALAEVLINAAFVAAGPTGSTPGQRWRLRRLVGGWVSSSSSLLKNVAGTTATTTADWSPAKEASLYAKRLLDTVMLRVPLCGSASHCESSPQPTIGEKVVHTAHRLKLSANRSNPPPPSANALSRNSSNSSKKSPSPPSTATGNSENDRHQTNLKDSSASLRRRAQHLLQLLRERALADPCGDLVPAHQVSSSSSYAPAPSVADRLYPSLGDGLGAGQRRAASMLEACATALRQEEA